VQPEAHGDLEVGKFLLDVVSIVLVQNFRLSVEFGDYLEEADQRHVCDAVDRLGLSQFDRAFLHVLQDFRVRELPREQE